MTWHWHVAAIVVAVCRGGCGRLTMVVGGGGRGEAVAGAGRRGGRGRVCFVAEPLAHDVDVRA